MRESFLLFFNTFQSRKIRDEQQHTRERAHRSLSRGKGKKEKKSSHQLRNRVFFCVCVHRAGGTAAHTQRRVVSTPHAAAHAGLNSTMEKEKNERGREKEITRFCFVFSVEGGEPTHTTLVVARETLSKNSLSRGSPLESCSKLFCVGTKNSHHFFNQGRSVEKSSPEKSADWAATPASTAACSGDASTASSAESEEPSSESPT